MIAVFTQVPAQGVAFTTISSDQAFGVFIWQVGWDFSAGNDSTGVSVKDDDWDLSINYVNGFLNFKGQHVKANLEEVVNGLREIKAAGGTREDIVEFLLNVFA